MNRNMLHCVYSDGTAPIYYYLIEIYRAFHIIIDYACRLEIVARSSYTAIFACPVLSESVR